jgi:hypothetical protein
MFSKFFKRKKHLSNNIDDTELENLKTKPLIYFSTDKGKYVCTDAPDYLNIIRYVEYNPEDYYSIKSEYISHENIDYNYRPIIDVYDCYFDYNISVSKASKTNENISERNSVGNVNLDYISRNFWFDKNNAIYLFNRKDKDINSVYSNL